MYSFSYLEPVCCSMSRSNYCFLTCIQISQEAGQVVWYSHLLKNFPHRYLCTMWVPMYLSIYIYLSMYLSISVRLLKTIGNSLVVQWLGLTAITAMIQVWSLVGKDPTSLTARPEKQTQIHMTSNSNPTTKASLFFNSFPRSEEPGPR